jgi:hypothetical protein
MRVMNLGQETLAQGVLRHWHASPSVRSAALTMAGAPVTCPTSPVKWLRLWAATRAGWSPD